MNTSYTEKVRFSQLKEGDMFTFRKNGEVDEYDFSSECIREDNYIGIDGIYATSNVTTFCGAKFNIKNHRCWVWRLSHKVKKTECDGCKYEWAVPSHEKCQGCARMYIDNYSRKEI